MFGFVKRFKARRAAKKTKRKARLWNIAKKKNANRAKRKGLPF